MRQTHPYTARDYVNQTGFPLVWICRCCCGTQRRSETIEEEAEEYASRARARQAGVVIGKPLKYDLGRMRYEREVEAKEGQSEGQRRREQQEREEKLQQQQQQEQQVQQKQ